MLRDPTHLYEGQLDPRTERIAEIFSTIGQPVFLPIPVFLLLCLLTEDAASYALTAVLSLLFVAAIPTIVTYSYSIKMGRKDGDIPDRTKRTVPLIIGVSSYAVGTVAMYLIGAPKIITVLMLAYTVVTMFILLVTLRWKISIHAVGVIGPTMALSYAFWPWGLLYLLWLPPIVWSRYVLRKHTPAQLVAGALSGLVITGILFILLLQ